METAAYRGRTHVSTRLRTKIPEDTSCISGGVHTCPVTEKANRPNRESIQTFVPIVNPNFGLKPLNTGNLQSAARALLVCT